MSIEAQHTEMVSRLMKRGEDIQLTEDQRELLHMLVGLCGEAGELLDAIKKHVFYNQELDLENAIEELGDIEFYLQGIRLKLKLQRFQILHANVAKLTKRYGHSYSDEAAKERRDKR